VNDASADKCGAGESDDDTRSNQHGKPREGFREAYQKNGIK
jgi:hypothetical protein